MSSATRTSATVLPVAIVVASTLTPTARWLAVVVLLLGLVVLRKRHLSVAWHWAALVPIAVRLAWSAAVPAPAPALADCANLLSPTALGRIIEAALVLATIAALAVLLRSDRASLAVGWPAPAIVALSIAAPLVITPVALIVGPMLTGPFFGTVRIETGLPAAIVPAFALAFSNATMEELTFRGAILGWGSRTLGPTRALVLQAGLFGLTHAGTDFVDPLGQAVTAAAARGASCPGRPALLRIRLPGGVASGSWQTCDGPAMLRIGSSSFGSASSSSRCQSRSVNRSKRSGGDSTPRRPRARHPISL